MKVVINTNDHNFDLSYKAYMRYAELAGIKLYPCVQSHANYPNVTLFPYDPSNSHQGKNLILFSTKPLPNHGDKEEKSTTLFTMHDLMRNGPFLVQVVEELGKEANNEWVSLKVVEIPDGVKWEIVHRDGEGESVEERHRSWR